METLENLRRKTQSSALRREFSEEFDVSLGLQLHCLPWVGTFPTSSPAVPLQRNWLLHGEKEEKGGTKWIGEEFPLSVLKASSPLSSQQVPGIWQANLNHLKLDVAPGAPLYHMPENAKNWTLNPAYLVSESVPVHVITDDQTHKFSSSLRLRGFAIRKLLAPSSRSGDVNDQLRCALEKMRRVAPDITEMREHSAQLRQGVMEYVLADYRRDQERVATPRIVRCGHQPDPAATTIAIAVDNVFRDTTPETTNPFKAVLAAHTDLNENATFGTLMRNFGDMWFDKCLESPHFLAKAEEWVDIQSRQDPSEAAADDMTRRTILRSKLVADLLGPEEFWRHWQIERVVNLWISLTLGGITRDPLAVMDYRQGIVDRDAEIVPYEARRRVMVAALDDEEDLTNAKPDCIPRQPVFEAFGVKHRPSHQWYVRERMEFGEAYLFLTGGGKKRSGDGLCLPQPTSTPHAAIEGVMPGVDVASAPRRKSVELRTFVLKWTG